MSNLKEIKDAARQAFSDQQSQDTEGGVPDAVSFIAGFLAGYRHIEKELNEVEIREATVNRSFVDLARKFTELQEAFDDRVRVIEMQLEDKEKLQDENIRLRKYFEMIANYATELNKRIIR